MHGKSYVSERNGVAFIGNGELEASIELGCGPRLCSIANKITGRTFHISDSRLCALRVADGKQRIDIAEWRFHPGSGEHVPRERERGFVSGFSSPGLDCGSWMTVDRLNAYPIGGVGYSTVLYPGYGWYRAEFEVPAGAASEPVELHLGGYDNQDWLEYWVYVNGEFVGHAAPQGFWHSAPVYLISPGSKGYQALNFGGTNVLAVQARGLDRRFPGMSIPDAERYSVDSLLVEQYVSIGRGERWVEGFEPHGHSLLDDASESALEISFLSESEKIEVRVRYSLPSGEPVLHKRVTMRNLGTEAVTLLEIELERLSVDAEATIGGMGAPCFIGGELFAGVAHPAGLARGMGNTVSLSTMPGRIVEPGGSYESKTMVLGVGGEQQAGRAFTGYLSRHGHRKREPLSMYHCYGLHDIAGIDEPTDLTEEMILANLNDIAQLNAMGVRFDYYFIDAGWSNPTGDLKDFDPRFFPNGPERVIGRISELGMKLGLWTSPACGPMAFHPGAAKPELAGCGTLASADGSGHRGMLCMASEPWRSMYRDALEHHVRHNGCTGFKLDANALACNNPSHGHMLGLYSVEALVDATIDTLEAVRRKCPDVLIMYYWGIRSPWWLLWGDTIYERGVLMEGSTASDAPTRLLRESVTISFDQAAHHAWDMVPLESGDSLGVWISKWRWANYMGPEGWRDAWLMDIARGSMMRQLWGDLSMFADEDREFLARVAEWLRGKEQLLREPQRILGSPWKAEPYGYAYSEPGRWVAFIYNPTFDRQHVDFLLGDNHLNTELGPFQVRVIEVTDGVVSEFTPPLNSAEHFDNSTRLPCDPRQVSCQAIGWDNPEESHFMRRVINGRAGYVDMKEQFGPDNAVWADERDTTVVRRVMSGEIGIPSMGGASSLLLVCQAARDGIHWHHHALYDIILPKVTMDGESVELRSTPHRWHEEAGGWSWIAFEAPIRGCPAARTASVEITAYLPDTVELTVSARLLCTRPEVS